MDERGKIVLDQKLSLWLANGFTLPANVVSFREQTIGTSPNQQVAMVIVWRPEPKHKTGDEV